VLIGGLYGVSIGRMFFGESMFARRTDASKIALAALVQTLRSANFCVIDCQQSTAHLASLGAREISRNEFLEFVARMTKQPAPDWPGLTLLLPPE
ncbi:MAG: leucyl/phenylalanyl-tRNA--protein transferase, partial [Quisquiliibacterium sp.]